MLVAIGSPAPSPPDPATAGVVENLLGLDQDELGALAGTLGEAPYRGRQLFSAIYRSAKTEIDALTTLSKALRTKLALSHTISYPSIDACQVSKDGTRKYRFVGQDGAAFESVYIPEVARGSRTNTLCVSSQTGCAVGCKFCFTASIRRNRDLTPAEIVGQVMAVQQDVGALGASATVTNIVFMGMGEPLLNYQNVIKSIRLLLDPEGLDFSSRRITVSTSGIVPRIYDLGRDVPTQLAISLNATTDETRTAIMPINKKWPLKTLIEALRAYPLPPRRRITIEYVMLGGLNDTDEDARRLCRLLRDIPVKINLLPLNPHDRTPFTPPTPNRVQAFQNILRKSGHNAIRRTPRGQDIAAACGQLGETVVS